jgi:hypothetical protein
VHAEAAKVQRAACQNAAAALEESGLDAELRDLADYDRAFGVDFEDGQVFPSRRQGDDRVDR